MYNIGIVGIDKGEGVTSLAVGMSTYLHEARCKKTAMVEMNEDQEFCDIRSCYYGENYEGNPFELFKVNYYPGVTKGEYARICNMGYDVVITDFGSSYNRIMEDFLRCDKKIVVGSINLWKYRKYLEFMEYVKNFPGMGSWTFLLSGDEQDIRMIQTKHGTKALEKKFFSNPYVVTQMEAGYYERILE